MKLLFANEKDQIVQYREFPLSKYGWWVFLHAYVQLHLPDKWKIILKARQDKGFRHLWPAIPETNKSEFYIIGMEPDGTISNSPQGSVIGLGGRDYCSVDEFVKTVSWE